ncbi:Retrotransposable element Tf2 [Senna tora]|uniref:Retrotransposable element Tf2 n=1 Tax=Senna tora TaxID=362788 RepID=A0A834XDE1_9FABA|nr:Retrotransposable element Tf2 [Senna tora]
MGYLLQQIVLGSYVDGHMNILREFIEAKLSERSFRGMVGTRMEGRVDSVEKNVGEVKENVTVLQGEVTEIKRDVNSLKESVLEIKDSLARLEKKNTDVNELDRSEGSGSHGGGGNNEQHVGEPNGKEGEKYRKLELPIFDGEAIGWLFRVERYFSLNHMNEGEKLEAVAVCMEGKALNWLQWLETRMTIQSWGEFKKELLRRFHQSQQGNNYEVLMALKQEGSMAEYREKFELISAPLKDTPEEMLLGAYQNGLKEDIRAELRMVKAHSLLEVMDMSYKVEERNRVLAKLREEQDKASKAIKVFQSTKWTTTRPNFSKPTTQTESNASNAKTNGATNVSCNTKNRSSTEKKTVSTSSTGRSKYRRLTDEEIARKRALGECFTCDEKYSPTHKCKNKHLHVLILSSSLEEGEEDDEIQKEGEELTGSLMSLSMNSIVGITGGRTMKLVGKIKGEEVLIMIDSGASHNFISTSLVDKMSLPKVKMSSYTVTVRDGHSVKSEGRCKKLKVELQGTTLMQDFYLFDLGEVDLILGMEWLKSLGEVSVNWKQLSIKYKLGGEMVSLKAVMRSIKKGGQGFLIELGTMEAHVKKDEPVYATHSQGIFFSTGCHPPRTRDHAILIKEGSQPPNIRPYR